MTNDSFGDGHDDENEDRLTLAAQPVIPRLRLFTVHTSKSFLVEAHQVELSANGDLLFYAYAVIQGSQVGAQLRRAFAKGEWRDLEEVLTSAGSTRIN